MPVLRNTGTDGWRPIAGTFVREFWICPRVPISLATGNACSISGPSRSSKNAFGPGDFCESRVFVHKTFHRIDLRKIIGIDEKDMRSVRKQFQGFAVSSITPVRKILDPLHTFGPMIRKNSVAIGVTVKSELRQRLRSTRIADADHSQSRWKTRLSGRLTSIMQSVSDKAFVSRFTRIR